MRPHVLVDTYSRVATDLRVSLTDRCNLRCTYCMPEEGLRWPAKPDLLTDDEIVRLIAVAVTSLEGMVTAGDVLASLRTRFELTAEGGDKRGSAPAERWLVDGGPHVVGVRKALGGGEGGPGAGRSLVRAAGQADVGDRRLTR
ncbi:hypothetical protein QFZ66_000933 [Streptomyces sp. B4I13]|nr:hypothetical protein [Streptomyces sp. B4I13]